MNKNNLRKILAKALVPFILLSTSGCSKTNNNIKQIDNYQKEYQYITDDYYLIYLDEKITLATLKINDNKKEYYNATTLEYIGSQEQLPEEAIMPVSSFIDKNTFSINQYNFLNSSSKDLKEFILDSIILDKNSNIYKYVLKTSNNETKTYIGYSYNNYIYDLLTGTLIDTNNKIKEYKFKIEDPLTILDLINNYKQKTKKTNSNTSSNTIKYDNIKSSSLYVLDTTSLVLEEGFGQIPHFLILQDTNTYKEDTSIHLYKEISPFVGGFLEISDKTIYKNYYNDDAIYNVFSSVQLVPINTYLKEEKDTYTYDELIKLYNSQNDTNKTYNKNLYILDTSTIEIINKNIDTKYYILAGDPLTNIYYDVFNPYSIVEIDKDKRIGTYRNYQNKKQDFDFIYFTLSIEDDITIPLNTFLEDNNLEELLTNIEKVEEEELNNIYNTINMLTNSKKRKR